MTQFSQPWGGVSVGDAGPYNDDQWSDMFHSLFLANRVSQGVLATFNHPTLNGLLAVSNPSGTTIRVTTGAALVDGKYYINDANIDTVLVAPGSGTDYYRVVLRKSWSGQTVRVVFLGPVNGGPATAVTQTDGTTWEIPLATVTITSANAITITDERKYAISPLSTMQLIAETVATAGQASIAFSGILPGYRHLKMMLWGRSQVTTSTQEFAALTVNGGAQIDHIRTRLFNNDVYTSQSDAAATGPFIARLSSVNGGLAVDYRDMIELDILHYADATFYKNILSKSTYRSGYSTTDVPMIQFTSSWVLQTSPITSFSIDLAGAGFAAGSRATLYGIL